MNIFEYAVRNKLRFNYKGSLSVEDLWDLSQRDLNALYKQLKSLSKENDEDSLMTTKSKADTVIEVSIEIVKYIFAAKEEAAEKAKKAAENRKQREKLMGILAEQEEKDLRGKSADELRAMIAELED